MTLTRYRGGKICLDGHFRPLWARNVPRFGIAHAMALGVRGLGLGVRVRDGVRVTARVRVRVSARGARRVASCVACRDVAATARGCAAPWPRAPPGLAPTWPRAHGGGGGGCTHGTAYGATCHAVRSRACAVRADGAVARRRDPRARGGRTVRTRQPKSHPHPPAASRQPRRPSVAPADMRVPGRITHKDAEKAA